MKKREAERRREKNNEAKSSGFCILNGLFMCITFSKTTTMMPMTRTTKASFP